MNNRSLHLAAFAMPLAFLLFATGCSKFPHSWQHRPVIAQQSAYASADEAVSWTKLEPSQFVVVPNLRQKHNPQWNEAVALLERESVAELTPAQHSRITLQPSWPGHDDVTNPLKPYLVRGVVHGSPLWTNVRLNPSGDVIWVSQGSWNGETLLGDFMMQEPAPVVVYLPRRPTEVFATSFIGGDGVFRNDDTLKPATPVSSISVRSASSEK